MRVLHFPKPFKHEHPNIRNVNDIIEEQSTIGQHAADWVAKTVGCWRFIIIQSVLLTIWVVTNVLAIAFRWDPYPFILMNLVLSLQAAYTAPIIMMSQNRSAARDRLEAHNDYLINQKAEEEIRALLEHQAARDQALDVIHQMLVDLKSQMDQGTAESR
ncbi:MAG: DUF1003 domain-containing protein [bacterium]